MNLPLSQQVVKFGMQIDDDNHTPNNDQVHKYEEQNESVVSLSMQLQNFLGNIMKGFDTLSAKVESENSKLAECLNAETLAENAKLVEHIENTTKSI